MDVDTRAISVVLPGAVGGLLSADGRWVVALLGPAEMSGTTAVFPLAEPRRAALVAHDSAAPSFSLRWGATAVGAAYLSRLVIAAPTAAIPLTVRYRLTASGLRPSGDTIPTRRLRWWSTDSSIATVTDSGEVTPRRLGTVTIHVTAGGWRGDSVRVTIGAAQATTVLSESWRGHVENAWRLFGRPRPTLESGPGGIPSFLNSGDGRYNSSGYSAREFSASSGLGLEADVSTPLTSAHWQVLYVQLDADLDSVTLAHWDHSTGYLPHSGLSASGTTVCIAFVPAGEGWDASRLLGLQAGLREVSVALPRASLEGRWYRVQVQLFPDGRCGVAVDGRPVWVSGTALPLDRPFRVVLQGNSAGTRMLFGPVEVWEGVRGDVDWRVVGGRTGR